jgi:hypothetical protein
MKDRLKNFLDKIAKTNQQAFQGQRMDCCELNRSGNAISAAPKKKSSG